jgi:hypothetical protein
MERRIQGFWWRNVRERDHFGDPGFDDNIRWIILIWIFRKWGLWVWTRLRWLRIRTCDKHL